MDKQGGIYKIQNTVNGKRYIGSAVKLKKRWGEHRRALTRGVHHSVKLQRAWNKYGAAAFEFIPMLICDLADLIPHEQLALDGLKPEYNICLTAGSSLGIKTSDESRKKMSAAGKGRKKSAEHKAKISAAHIGKTQLPHTPEARSKISAALYGRPVSIVTRTKMSKSLLGNTRGLGKKRSAETQAKINATRQRNALRGVA